MSATLQTTAYTGWQSPVGELLLIGDEDALRAIHFPGRHRIRGEWIESAEPFADAIEQLGRYFAGERVEFGLKVEMPGSEFDRSVWDELWRIPYGETRSYGEIARAIGCPDRARAVGSANARNPVPIVVPCHRVIGADGSLVGYGGGLDLKRELLELEAGARQQTLV